MVDRGSSSVGCGCQGLLVAYGAEHPVGGVPPLIVVSVDPIDNRGNDFSSGGVDVSIIRFVLCDVMSRVVSGLLDRRLAVPDG